MRLYVLSISFLTTHVSLKHLFNALPVASEIKGPKKNELVRYILFSIEKTRTDTILNNASRKVIVRDSWRTFIHTVCW